MFICLPLPTILPYKTKSPDGSLCHRDCGFLYSCIRNLNYSIYSVDFFNRCKQVLGVTPARYIFLLLEFICIQNISPKTELSNQIKIIACCSYLLLVFNLITVPPVNSIIFTASTEKSGIFTIKGLSRTPRASTFT